MLTLRIEFTTGRYVATHHSDRERAEWPPHPARVYSALVAAYYEGGQPDGGADALRWLERQPPPAVHFWPAHEREAKVQFVPVNDQALSDSAAISRTWAALRSATSEKQRAKAEAKLSDEYRKAGEVVTAGKVSKGQMADGQHVVPATRTRQPRYFPSVTPEVPLVFLTWPEPAGPHSVALDSITRCLARVGHSSSLVSASWLEAEPPTAALHWRPDRTGAHALRWVQQGQLDALDRIHGAAGIQDQRRLPFRPVRYSSDPGDSAMAKSSFDDRLIVYRRKNGPRVPIAATEALAGGFRRALLAFAGDDAPEIVSGHGSDGGPSQADHIAIVPLPYVDGRHATGDLLGVAVVVPGGASALERQALHAALASWEGLDRAEAGVHPDQVLVLGELGRWELSRVQLGDTLHNLAPATWTGPSSEWVSATPMLFDRHPGALTRGRSRALRRARETVETACVRIGLPPPLDIEFSAAPLLIGSSHVRDFRRPGRDERRPMTHLRLRFSQLVQGPVLLGAGRYRGLGLLRPVGGRRAISN